MRIKCINDFELMASSQPFNDVIDFSVYVITGPTDLDPKCPNLYFGVDMTDFEFPT